MHANLKVSAEGHVYVGDGEWASFESIQAAVLKATNPGLHTIDTTGNRQGQLQTTNTPKAKMNTEQPLPLPGVAAKPSQPTLGERIQALREKKADEHLIPPTTLRANEPEQPKTCGCNKEKQTTNASSGEHLELPSTFRKTT